MSQNDRVLAALTRAGARGITLILAPRLGKGYTLEARALTTPAVRCARFCSVCGATSWHLKGTDVDTCKRGHHVACEEEVA